MGALRSWNVLEPFGGMRMEKNEVRDKSQQTDRPA